MFELLRSGAWLTFNRRRRITGIALVGFALALGFIVLTSNGGQDFRGRPLGSDFVNVWSAGRLALEGAPEAAWDYDRHREVERALFPSLTTYYGWHYPPPLLMLAALLAQFPYLAALGLWQILSLLALFLASRGLSYDRLAAIAFPGLFVNLTHGHNGFLSAALMLGGLRLLEARPWLAGALLGCLSYKPQIGLLIPVALAASGYWRSVGGAALSATALACLSWLVLGASSWQAFFDSAELTRHAVLEAGAIGFGKMQSVFAAAKLLGLETPGAWAIQGLSALLGGVSVFILWRRPGQGGAARALALVLGTMLAAPYLLDYDLMLLAAPLLLKSDERRFMPWETSYYALLWALPLFARPVGVLVGLPLSPLAALLGLWLLLSRRNPV